MKNERKGRKTMRNSKKKETRESVNISKYREEKGITLIALVITIVLNASAWS